MAPPVSWQLRRRARFLRRRARAGLQAPAESSWGVCNADGVTGPRRGGRIVGLASIGVDVLAGVEAHTTDVDAVLNPNRDVAPLFDVAHAGGDRDPARRATFLAVRASRGRIEDWWLRPSVRPFIRRNGRRIRVRMRTRWELGALVVLDPDTPQEWRVKAKVGHGPPPRNPLGRLWPAWGRSFRQGRQDVYLYDGNKHAPQMGRLLRRRIRQLRGVMGIGVRWWFPSSTVRAVRIAGADHAVAVVSLWHRLDGHRRR